MTWLELKNEYIKNHYDEMLGNHEEQVNSLLEIDEILNQNYPDIIKDPSRLKNYSAIEFTELIRQKKPLAEITGADKDLINGLYELLNR